MLPKIWKWCNLLAHTWYVSRLENFICHMLDVQWNDWLRETASRRFQAKTDGNDKSRKTTQRFSLFLVILWEMLFVRPQSCWWSTYLLSSFNTWLHPRCPRCPRRSPGLPSVLASLPPHLLPPLSVGHCAHLCLWCSSLNGGLEFHLYPWSNSQRRTRSFPQDFIFDMKRGYFPQVQQPTSPPSPCSRRPSTGSPKPVVVDGMMHLQAASA